MPYGTNILGDEIGGRDLLRRGALRLRRLTLPPGGLSISGVPQFNPDLHLKTNDKIFFGDDDDSSILFNGTDLVVAPGGDLLINADTIGIALGAATGGDARIYFSGSALTLIGDSTASISIESTVIALLGDLRVSSNALLNVALSNDTIRFGVNNTTFLDEVLIQNPDDGVSNKVLTLIGNDRADPFGQANDEGYVRLDLDTDTGASREFARLTWVAIDPANASKDGALEFAVMVADTLTKILTINSSGIDVVGLATLTGGIANTLTDNVIHGEGAGGSLSSGALRNVFIGNDAGNAMTTADDTVMIGDDAGLLNTAAQNVFIGSGAGEANVTGADCLFIGFDAGRLSTASSNLFIGGRAGEDTTSGSVNVFIGFLAGANNQTGNNNVFIGANAGRDNTTEKQLFIGAEAGKVTTSGSGNVFIGFRSGLDNLTGKENTCIGTSSGENLLNDRNTYIGMQAGLSITTGNNNVGIGFQAGADNLTGSFCVFLGVGADVTGSTALSHSIAIGVNAAVTASNQMVIGSPFSTITDAYIGSGVQDSSASTVVLQSTGGSGTDNAGADFNLAAGKGTGTAIGGAIALQVSPATGDSDADLNPLVDVVKAGVSGTASTLGFYAATPVTLQTGVAVTDAGIHAALVNLGLITA